VAPQVWSGSDWTPIEKEETLAIIDPLDSIVESETGENYPKKDCLPGQNNRNAERLYQPERCKISSTRLFFLNLNGQKMVVGDQHTNLTNKTDKLSSHPFSRSRPSAVMTIYGGPDTPAIKQSRRDRGRFWANARICCQVTNIVPCRVEEAFYKMPAKWLQMLGECNDRVFIIQGMMTRGHVHHQHQ